MGRNFLDFVLTDRESLLSSYVKVESESEDRVKLDGETWRRYFRKRGKLGGGAEPRWFRERKSKILRESCDRRRKTKRLMPTPAGLK